MNKKSKNSQYRDDEDTPRSSNSFRNATAFAMGLALVGGAWVNRDYITGEISGANRQKAAQKAPEHLVKPVSDDAEWQEKERRRDKNAGSSQDKTR
ncbi:MAG: hypothetical protein LW823_06380 [Rickettsiales bacterium]|jgi:hypothetical protein|nr:hypothetical protein [Rickettsiales bacterium]